MNSYKLGSFSGEIKMYIDCHAHIFFSPIPVEAITVDIMGEVPTPTTEFIKKIIINSREKGVEYIVAVISNPDDFHQYKKQITISNIIHVIGVSRNHASEDNSNLLSQLQAEIEREKPNAIGEIGIDYTFGFDHLSGHKRRNLRKSQQDLFQKQIQLAKEIDVPIVVHAGYRDDKDIVKILKQERAQEIGGQIHGYMSNKEIITELLDFGFYFSIGYVHLIENEFKSIIDMVPLEQLLTETDSPYHLLQSPKRFILPEDVVMVANEISKIKGIEEKVLATQVLKNAKELFRF